MSNQVVIYKQDDGVAAVLIPTPDCLQAYTIQQIANKDVPPGKPYAIVDHSSVPWGTPQAAWVISDSDLTDGVGAESSEFPN